MPVSLVKSQAYPVISTEAVMLRIAVLALVALIGAGWGRSYADPFGVTPRDETASSRSLPSWAASNGIELSCSGVIHL